MNNNQYERIGESIWNTYEDMAYIFLETSEKPETTEDYLKRMAKLKSRTKEGLAQGKTHSEMYEILRDEGLAGRPEDISGETKRRHGPRGTPRTPRRR